MNKKKRKTILIIEILVLIIIVAFALFLVFGRDKKHGNDEEKDGNSKGEQALMTYPIELEQNLFITKLDNYAGMYVEDGSNEVVQDVMMIVLENRGEHDLQYAEISLEFEAGIANFTVSNLPAGKSAVLLETNRESWTGEEPISVATEYVVFFDKPMSSMEDKVKITGQKQNLTVENLSDQDISNPVYIYYKNYVGNLFYGGITYRVQLPEGIAKGESIQLMTEHYDPESSLIVDVVEVKQND